MIQIPFDSHGNMVSYQTSRATYRDNYRFSAGLTLVDFERGRSAMNFIFEDVEGHRYSMFLHEFRRLTKLFNEGIINNVGHIDGLWTFRKQGANYSITLVVKEDKG
jgi:hypothetical protein